MRVTRGQESPVNTSEYLEDPSNRNTPHPHTHTEQDCGSAITDKVTNGAREFQWMFDCYAYGKKTLVE